MFKRLVKLGVIFVVLGIGALFVYYVFFLHFIRVPTGAMANTIIPGDHLIVKKRAFGDINRGDLIVFKYSDDVSHYLARVIGLPDEAIQIRGRIIFINNKELPERRVFVKPDNFLETGVLEELASEGTGSYSVFYEQGAEEAAWPETENGTSAPFQIPSNHYFVMGDHRDHSHDSRFRGPVSREAIFGKPTMIYWSQYERLPQHDQQIRWDRIFTKVK